MSASSRHSPGDTSGYWQPGSTIGSPTRWEYVNRSVLPQLGVPADVAAAVPFGANVNASSFRSRGLETSADFRAGSIELFGSYTFVDAEVTASFSSSALTPIFNPAWPDIPIGQYGPLVGGRPFQRPRHVASLRLSYIPWPTAM